MLHEYQPDYDGWCQRCGLHAADCTGRRAEEMVGRLVFFARDAATGLWKRDDVLQWRDEQQRAVYASWEAYDAAMETADAGARWLGSLAEIRELDRWWRL